MLALPLGPCLAQQCVESAPCISACAALGCMRLACFLDKRHAEFGRRASSLQAQIYQALIAEPFLTVLRGLCQRRAGDWWVQPPSEDSHTLSGARSPAISRNVVLFPVPEPPIMPTASPLLMVMLTPFKIFLLPNDLWTSLSSMSTSSCSLCCKGCATAVSPYCGLGIVLTALCEAVVA